MIGIIGAMEEEVKALLDKTEDIHENKILDCVFYEGKIDNKQVVILQGGIGKVNSAICVTLLLTNYDIEYVINIGSAGGLKDYQNVGDVVISSHVSYHDVDLTAFGRPMGELPELPVFIPADENLVNKAKELLETTNMKISQIAKEVGFSNNSYFCRSFREFFGDTPEACRKGIAADEKTNTEVDPSI